MWLNRLILGILFSSSLYAMDDVERQKTQQRIQPVGQVHSEEKNKTVEAVTLDTKAKTEVKKGVGQEVYEQHCVVCHRDGLIGAPKFEDKKEWDSRLTGRTLEDLVASSLKGLNAMPMKGTCTECSSEDLKAAIQFMLPKS